MGKNLSDLQVIVGEKIESIVNSWDKLINRLKNNAVEHANRSYNQEIVRLSRFLQSISTSDGRNSYVDKKFDQVTQEIAKSGSLDNFFARTNVYLAEDNNHQQVGLEEFINIDIAHFFALQVRSADMQNGIEITSHGYKKVKQEIFSKIEKLIKQGKNLDAVEVGKLRVSDFLGKKPEEIGSVVLASIIAQRELVLAQYNTSNKIDILNVKIAQNIAQVDKKYAPFTELLFGVKKTGESAAYSGAKDLEKFLRNIRKTEDRQVGAQNIPVRADKHVPAEEQERLLKTLPYILDDSLRACFNGEKYTNPLTGQHSVGLGLKK